MKRLWTIILIILWINSCKVNTSKHPDGNYLTGNDPVINDVTLSTQNIESIHNPDFGIDTPFNDTGTLCFDPIIIRIENHNNNFVITNIIERSDTCIFHIADPTTIHFYPGYYTCLFYDSFLELLKRKRISGKTSIGNSLGNNNIPALCGYPYENRHLQAETLTIEFPGFTCNFADNTIFILYKRIVINNRLLGVFINEKKFSIVCWNINSHEPELTGFTNPSPYITLNSYDIVENIRQIDSLHYLITGVIPEIDYLDGPSQVNNYQQVWLGIYKLPNTFYYISNHDTRCNYKRLTLENTFTTFFVGEDYSNISIKEITGSQVVFKTEIGLCNEEKLNKIFESMEVPDEELEGYQIDCPTDYFDRLDTLDLNYVKEKLITAIN